VPFGLRLDEILVSARDAVRAEYYCCPACRTRLIYRAGPKVRPHFAHRSSATCNGETALHLIAKMLLAQAVRAATSGNAFITIVRPCDSCETKIDVPFPSDTVDQVEQECRLESGYIADVLLLQGGNPRLAIEVRATHAVPAEKASRLGMRWIEVAAEQILENPTRWVLLAYSLKAKKCDACLRKAEEAERRARVAAAEPLVKIPQPRKFRARSWPTKAAQRPFILVPPPPPPPVPPPRPVYRAICKICGKDTEDMTELTPDAGVGTCRTCWKKTKRA